MKRFFSIILAIAVGFCAFGAADVYYFGEAALAAFADEPSAPSAPVDPVSPVPNEITAENVSLEYTTISFNGGSRKPAVTVKLGETVLREGVDFTAKYPEDCVNAGKKTVAISGKGGCKGEVRTSYMILPLDCSNNSEVTAEVGDCRYNGLPQYPEITVKLGDYVIPKDNYSVTLSGNTEVSTDTKKALCRLQFRGNCTGERTEEFNILKRSGEDFDIDVTARAGQSLSIDLSPLKPAGAIFGNPAFPSADFSPNDQPKIAFNMLRFTLSPTLDRSTSIAIPMTNIANGEDCWLEFYIEPTEREIPQLVLKPLAKEYDGKPFKAYALNDNGSYAHINGEKLEGEWSFVEPSSKAMTMPCDKTAVSVKFTPDDPRYSHAYGLVSVSILRKEASKFDVDCDTSRLDFGDTLTLTVKGIPDDFDGSLTLTSAHIEASDGSDEDDFFILSERETSDGREYEIEFPLEDAYHTLKATLGGSAFYAPKTIELKIRVGDPPAAPPSDVPTTERQLEKLIADAQADSTIKANRMTSVSAGLLRSAAAKRLTIEIRANDFITYVLEPAKMKSVSTLDLTTANAIIPKVLIDRLGDEEIYSFTTFAKGNGGVSIKAAVGSKPNPPIICFYKYGASGELEHIASVRRKGNTAQFELPGSGKFTVTASSVSHIYRDLDNDCRITLNDVSIALDLYLLLTGKPSAQQVEALDFNNDGDVTLDDVSILLDYYLSI